MNWIPLFFFVVISHLAFGQELSLNESNKFYEYSHVKEHKIEKPSQQFYARLSELNYKDIIQQSDMVIGEGFTNHLVGGFATVEIKYLVKIEFKDDRYKLTLTNFILTDKNGSNPLEGMGSFKKKWAKIINKKLPEIITNMEKLKSEDDW